MFVFCEGFVRNEAHPFLDICDYVSDMHLPEGGSRCGVNSRASLLGLEPGARIDTVFLKARLEDGVDEIASSLGSNNCISKDVAVYNGTDPCFSRSHINNQACGSTSREGAEGGIRCDVNSRSRQFLVAMLQEGKLGLVALEDAFAEHQGKVMGLHTTRTDRMVQQGFNSIPVQFTWTKK